MDATHRQTASASLHTGPSLHTSSATRHTASNGITRRLVAAASIGNALEFYDFIIFGFFAVPIGETFFPGHDAITRLLLTFGTFGVSFFARPIGALVLGAYADRRGRARCMTVAVALMTLAGALIALLPGRAEIGIAAPLGVLASRLLQGFALGGEFGASTALMIEHAANAETRSASWQGTSQTLSAAFASGVAWLLTAHPAITPFHVAPFRLAFAVGVAAGPVALLLRRTLEDAPGVVAERRGRAPDPFLPDRDTLGGIAIAAGLVAIGTAQTYLVIYLPTYAATELHLRLSSALGSVFLTYVATLALTPLRLRIASRFDRSRRSGAMLLSCVLMLATAYPSFVLLGLWPGRVMLFAIPLALVVIGLPYNAPLAGVMGLVFPARRRGVGLSVGYALGIMLFGGTAPLINTWLVARTGDPRSPGLYLALTAAITIGAVLLARRRLADRSAPAAADTRHARTIP